MCIASAPTGPGGAAAWGWKDCGQEEQTVSTVVSPRPVSRSKPKYVRRAAAAASATAPQFAVHSVRAADIFWDRTTGDYSNIVSWAVDVQPTTPDNAVFDNAGTVPILTGADGHPQE